MAIVISAGEFIPAGSATVSRSHLASRRPAAGRKMPKISVSGGSRADHVSIKCYKYTALHLGCIGCYN
jgi:hypothetical protein